MAKMATIKFACEPTQTKCSLSICHILVHTNLILAMFKSATSTMACKLNFLGFIESDNSCLETLQRFSMKQMTASWSRLMLDMNIPSSCALEKFWTINSEFAWRLASRCYFEIVP